MTAIDSLFLIAAPLLGLLVGSFLNVCIHRIPLGMSIVHPGSSCPQCGLALRWFHNIPVVSYVLLQGKCAGCGARISKRYPAVELMTGGLYALAAFTFGFSPAFWICALFVSILLVLTFIDLDHRIIPDVISLPGIVIGFILSFLTPGSFWIESILGILLGGGGLLVIACVYTWATGKDGMGGGDIKLLAMIGAFLGWKAVLPVLFIASLAGTLVGLPMMFIKNTDRGLAIPFGPFLSLGAVIWLFWGLSILYWYLSFFNLK